MKANELADELKKSANWSPDWNVLEQAATMLRQQQAEIEALKMDIHSLTYGKRLAEYLRKAQEK